jgi:transcription termination factor NusB
MCYNCGCGNPHDDMGDIDNITVQTLYEFAMANNTKIEKIKIYVLNKLENELLEKKKTHDPALEEMFTKAAEAWGQSVIEAKKQTYNLLKQELKK